MFAFQKINFQITKTSNQVSKFNVSQPNISASTAKAYKLHQMYSFLWLKQVWSKRLQQVLQNALLGSKITLSQNKLVYITKLCHHEMTNSEDNSSERCALTNTNWRFTRIIENVLCYKAPNMKPKQTIPTSEKVAVNTSSTTNCSPMALPRAHLVVTNNAT